MGRRTHNTQCQRLEKVYTKDHLLARFSLTSDRCGEASSKRSGASIREDRSIAEGNDRSQELRGAQERLRLGEARVHVLRRSVEARVQLAQPPAALRCLGCFGRAERTFQHHPDATLGSHMEGSEPESSGGVWGLKSLGFEGPVGLFGASGHVKFLPPRRSVSSQADWAALTKPSGFGGSLTPPEDSGPSSGSRLGHAAVETNSFSTCRAGAVDPKELKNSLLTSISPHGAVSTEKPHQGELARSEGVQSRIKRKP